MIRTVLVVSDHGVKRMDGGICLNEWLWREGWLACATRRPKAQITPSSSSRSIGRARGPGAAAAITAASSLTCQGREPQGDIPPEAYEATRDELAAALKAIPGAAGEALNTQVFKPEQIYRVGATASRPI